MNIKNIFVVALSALCLGSLSSYAQSSRNADDAKEEKSIESNTGASFIACSSGGAKMPTKLYYRTAKDEFSEVRFPMRSASIRLAFPSDGVYNFWLTDPKELSSSGDTDRRAKITVPEPDIKITLPTGLSGRVICLLQAKETEGGKLAIVPTCIPDEVLPKTGQTVLNLSPYNLVLATSPNGDFSNQQQVKIAACPNMKSIESSNICTIPGEPGQRMNFILSAALPSFDGLSRVRASTLSLSKTQSQVMVVVKKLDSADVTMETVQARSVAKSKKKSSSSKRSSR